MNKTFLQLTTLILCFSLFACSSPTEKEFRKTSKLAEQGQAEAQVRLAQMYLEGIGTEIDRQQSFHWIKKAAEQGNFQAFEWLRFQSQQGNEVAYQQIMQMIGQGNLMLARWLLQKAEAGDAWSQYAVGWMYDLGKGFILSPREAAKWYLKAAQQNFTLAQRVIGDKYYSGKGVNENTTTALYWYEKAANQNDVEAQYLLGRHYTFNYQENLQLELARKWLNKAHNNGHKDAANMLSYLEQQKSEMDQFNQMVMQHEQQFSVDTSQHHYPDDQAR